MTENSAITKTRRRKFCLASSDATKPLAPITHIAFGSGGVDASGEPVAPSETQTALNAELYRYPVDSVSYPKDTTARYAVTIPKDEHTGDNISEAALVDADKADMVSAVNGVVYPVLNATVTEEGGNIVATFESS